jgi:hypothetical protein
MDFLRDSGPTAIDSEKKNDNKKNFFEKNFLTRESIPDGVER